jgi:hypothetical protein
MKLLRITAVAIALAAAAMWVPGRAVASDSSDVMATVNGAVADFNKGDGPAWEARCDSSAPIVDGIPPFTFASCADWWSAHAAYSQKNGISDESVTTGKAWQMMVVGSHAFVAVPVNYAYKLKGKMMKAPGVLTIALRKTGTGWLMTGWSAGINMGGH